MDSLAVASRFAKEARWPFGPSHSEQNELARAAASRDMMRMALFSLGIGGAWRGAQGLKNLFKRTSDDDDESEINKYMPRPIEATVPVAKRGFDLFSVERAIRSRLPYEWGGFHPSFGKGPGKPGAGAGGAKPVAGSKYPSRPKPTTPPRPTEGLLTSDSPNPANLDSRLIGVSGPGMQPLDTPHLDAKGIPMGVDTPFKAPSFDTAGKEVTGTDKTAFDPLGWLSKVLMGEKATKKTGIPAWWVGMPTLGLGGLYGGYKGMDYLLDRRRREDQDTDLEDARDEFRRALRGQAAVPKIASDGETDMCVQLDRLYDQIVKRADDMEKTGVLENETGAALGGYGIYAALASLLTGTWMYNMTKKRSRANLLLDAQRKRLRQRYQTRPPEIMALPSLISARKPKKKKDVPQLTGTPEPVEA